MHEKTKKQTEQLEDKEKWSKKALDTALKTSGRGKTKKKRRIKRKQRDLAGIAGDAGQRVKCGRQALSTGLQRHYGDEAKMQSN